MERQVIESKLLATREELSKAGPIHAQDLQKYIHRLEKQLRIMNRRPAPRQTEDACGGLRRQRHHRQRQAH